MSSHKCPWKPLPIDRIYGRHNGEAIVVLGCSGSIDQVDLSLVNDLPKISIHRALRNTECQYMVISDPEVFHAVRTDIRRLYGNRWPELFIYSRNINNWRKHGLNLAGKIFYSMRLQWRDGWINQPGHYRRAPLPKDHPHIKWYKRPTGKAIRATEPGALQKDGPFMQSTCSAIYAIEIAYRMVMGERPSRILLLGVDLRPKITKSGKDLTYCRTIDTKRSSDKRCKVQPPDLIAPQIGRACKDLKPCVEIINCSPWSGPLDEFVPRRSLAEVIAEGSCLS